MRIVERPDLRARTTLRLGGVGLAELILREERDFDLLPAQLDRIGGVPVAWGMGSNILARDGELPLTLISMEPAGEPVIVSEEGGRVAIRVGGGKRLSGLISWCAKAGLTGLEPLTGIPGSVGGAVRMNAGSFGREMAEVMTRVRIWTRDGGLRWVGPEDWLCGYRTFQVRGVEAEWMAAEVELALARSAPNQVRARIAEIYARKKAAQPVAAKTCGCVFKNPPVGRPAGWLLEQSGYRGQRLGGVGFSDKHANFLVHYGGGTSSQALELIGTASEQVLKEHGIGLEMEVKVYPCQRPA
jgi:UDP-N-acetylmuramate dehydrogenase